MKILLVEDEPEKRHAISKALAEVQGVDADQIQQAPDGVSARKALSVERFDLVILDMQLPPRADLEAREDTGILLLQDLLEYNGQRYKVPTHVIGVTGFDDLHNRYRDSFSAKLLTFIKYDPAESEWSEALQARAAHIAHALSVHDSEPPQSLADVAIVVALREPEMEAFRRLPWQWSLHSQPRDHSVHWSGTIDSPAGPRTVRLVSANRMGMAPAAVLTTKLVELVRPRWVAMGGIAAGVKGKVNLGDVVIADPCWDAGAGKWLKTGDKTEFMPGPHHVPLEPWVRERCLSVATDHRALAEIRAAWRGAKPDTALAVHVGPMACVSAVMAEGETLAKIVSGQHRETMGLDMESYAVMLAAQDCSSPQPTAIVAKGIVDFADGFKDDRYRDYAAYASAEVLRLIFKDVL